MNDKKRIKQELTSKKLPNLEKSMVKALAWEEKRKADLKAGKITAVRKSYREQKEFLPDDNSGSFWDKLFAKEETSNSQFFAYQSPMEKWRIKLVLSQLNYQQSILNLGVGAGCLEARLLPKIQPEQYLGTDITKHTLKQLRRAFPNFQFKKTQLLQLPFADKSFDQILLLEVLEHIRPNQTFQVLAEIKRVLKEGGRFFVSVPVNEGLETMLPKNPNAHQRLYSRELLRFEIEESGFVVKKIYTASAFAKHFTVKHFINRIFKLRSANNHLLIAKKAN